jgi:hypothetical protein
MFDEGYRQERRNMEAYPQLKVEKWDRRHWAVYDGPELVCVTVYKKGAVEVKRRLEDAMSPGVEIASSPAYVQPALESTPTVSVAIT